MLFVCFSLVFPMLSFVFLTLRRWFVHVCPLFFVCCCMVGRIFVLCCSCVVHMLFICVSYVSRLVTYVLAMFSFSLCVLVVFPVCSLRCSYVFPIHVVLLHMCFQMRWICVSFSYVFHMCFRTVVLCLSYAFPMTSRYSFEVRPIIFLSFCYAFLCFPIDINGI